MTGKLIFISTWILLFLGCAESENHFLNLEHFNKSIKAEIGIDIFELEKKMDANLASNSNFYHKALWDLIDTENSEIFQKYGLLQIRDSGDSILLKDEMKYKKAMLISFQNAVDISNCASNSADSSCIWKNNIDNWVYREINEWNLDIRYSNICEDTERLYRKKYINENEYTFLVIFFHILMSIDALNNFPVE